MAIAGFACSPVAEMHDRRKLACCLDRLTLLSAGGSEVTAAFFSRAELRRTGTCSDATARPAVPARPDRLKPQQEPTLRRPVALR